MPCSKPSPPFLPLRELERLLASETLTLIDARAERLYQRAHLKGAINLPARSLNAPVDGVRQLISAAALERTLASLGIGRERLVVYGAKGGSDAAHVWWTLHAYGHPAVQLLDGGIEAWQAAGGALSDTPPTLTLPREAFTPVLDPHRLITLDELRERLEDPTLRLLDTRNADEFHGRDISAKRGGHIPGAQLYPWDEALSVDWTLQPDEVLQAQLAPHMSAPEVASYCQSGVRAAHTYALLVKLGHPNPRLYLGSWGEWGNREDTPIAEETSALPSSTP